MRLADMDVAEQAAEAVFVAQAGVRLELDLRAGPGEPLERLSCLPRVALSLAELGCVDLDEANAVAAFPHIERVPVADAGDCCVRAA